MAFKVTQPYSSIHLNFIGLQDFKGVFLSIIFLLLYPLTFFKNRNEAYGVTLYVVFLSFRRSSIKKVSTNLWNSIYIMIILDMISETTFWEHFLTLRTGHFPFFMHLFCMGFEFGFIGAYQITHCALKFLFSLAMNIFFVSPNIRFFYKIYWLIVSDCESWVKLRQ